MEWVEDVVVFLVQFFWRHARTSCTVFVASRMVINFLRMYKHHFRAEYLRPNTEEKLKNIFQPGKWAVITGSCNRIGRGYALLCAQRGLNLVLIDGNFISLNNFRDFLMSHHFLIEITLIPNDFSMVDENYKLLYRKLTPLNVSVLINNMHDIYPNPERFVELDDSNNLIENIIAANVFSCSALTKILLPQMILRQSGAIINVASMLVEIRAPMLSVYAASKAFVEKFTMDLIAEHEDSQNLIIQCVIPGLIECKWLHLCAASWLAPSGETYAEHALAMLGKHERTVGYFPHSLFIGFIQRVSYYSGLHGVRHFMLIFKNKRYLKCL